MQGEEQVEEERLKVSLLDILSLRCQLGIHLRCQRDCWVYGVWHVNDRPGLEIYIQESADSKWKRK